MKRKTMKKMLSSVLTLAMCLTLLGGQVMPAYATEGTEMVSPASNVAGNSLTVNNPVAGHEYRAYQIFTGDVNAGGNTLSNIRYGFCFANAGDAVTQEDLDKITDAKTFVKELLADSAGNYTSGGGVFSHGESDSSAVLTSENPTADLPAGYYLIIDTIKDEDGQGHGDAVSDFVVEIVGDKTFSPKATSVPTFDKSIDDSDEGNNGETGIGRIPTIDGLEDGESYEEGTVIAVGDGDVLIIDGTEVDSPFTLNGAGEHTVTVRDGKSKNETSYIITVMQKAVQIAPADEINDWRYELDNDDMTISLIQYTNTTKTDVTVYDAYTYNGLTYRTKIASNIAKTDMEGGEQYMFRSKGNIENITFCNSVDTSDVTNMSNMFFYCSKLKKLDLSCFDTQKVTDMKYMFYHCTSLTELDLSSFDTSNVTDMSYMFYQCSALLKLNVTSTS